jgi:ABC-type uncharacterized transport system involved in gliding motility auxiliary subunit
MANQNKKSSVSISIILWSAAGVLLLGLLFARAVYPELLWLTIVIGVPLFGVLGGLVQQNHKALRSRTAAYGLNSVITILLVLGIVGVLDFLTSRYPLKWDLTKNKIHTFSDQSAKLTKGLQKTVKATYFAKMQQREQVRPVLDNYKSLNPKFEVEYVDPDREPTRASQAGVKKYGTLLLAVGPRETRIEEVTEEKVTNALIKLLKDKSPTLCAITGHGEKSFSSQEAEGYSTAKKSLSDQAYEVKDVNILQETKIPEVCDAIAILGPTKAFFEAEIKAIQAYLENGGRALIAVDVNLKGGEYSPEFTSVLQNWHIKADNSLIVDPLSRMLGADASVSLLASYSKESPITKDFQTNCLFPFTRPLNIVPNAPASMNVQWIAQTTPKSWAVADMKQLAKGEVKFTEGKDKQGPLNAVVTVEGKTKDSKATKSTRLVVFGSSFFATNNFSRFGGNLDFFMNAVSWAMEDESLISIRAKEEGPGKVELSSKAGTTIFLLTVVVIPLAVAIGGLVIWILRRRL